MRRGVLLVSSGGLGDTILDAEQGLYPCVARLDEARAVAAAVEIWRADR